MPLPQFSRLNWDDTPRVSLPLQDWKAPKHPRSPARSEVSSPSVSQYHLRKLVQAGLVREVEASDHDQESGFVVDRIVFENIIRIRRSVIPFQVAYAVFFATMLVVLLTILRPAMLETPLFVFGLVATLSGLAFFTFEILKSVRTLD